MPDRFLRFPEVQARMGNVSRSTIERMVADGRLPPPRKIGLRVVAWLESELADMCEATPQVGYKVGGNRPEQARLTRLQPMSAPDPLNPATLEAAAKCLEMSNATIRLHAGELTADEMRAVQAVLAWKARELRGLAHPGFREGSKTSTQD